MKNNGLVFDIQRCSIHDGPGIRTTIFLKGCCKQCGACSKVCPSGCHEFIDGRHCFERDECTQCGACVKSCLYNALERKGIYTDIDTIFEEVEKDRAYYDASNGGITLSGGEPMAQYEFTMAILAEAKKRNIHSCLETSGFAPQDMYKSLLPFTGMFLYDYKAGNSLEYKAFTGVTNELILSNLDFLYSNGCKLILRCPFVPGVNDSEDHIAGISALSKKYPDILGIEIMSYHNMGIAKTKRLGKNGFYSELANTDERKKMEWIESFARYGCNVKIG